MRRERFTTEPDTLPYINNLFQIIIESCLKKGRLSFLSFDKVDEFGLVCNFHRFSTVVL